LDRGSETFTEATDSPAQEPAHPPPISATDAALAYERRLDEMKKKGRSLAAALSAAKLEANQLEAERNILQEKYNDVQSQIRRTLLGQL
jgi:FtsZ-binding cell division protein ZapB